MKRNFLSVLALMIALVAAVPGNYGSASAQQCCSYTVVISEKISEKCFPVTLSTRWNLNGTVATWATTYAAPGTYTVTPNVPPFTPCPTTYLDRLLYASVNNFGDVVFPNECGCNIDGATGCKLRICISDKSGCWTFTVSPCD